MRILLVKPYGPVRVPLPDVGMGFMARALIQAGHKTDYLEANLHARTIGQFCRRLHEHQPEAIGFKVFTEEMHAVRVYCRKARQILPDAHLIVGGPHPSAKMADTFSFIPELDYGIAGEGEVSLPLLLARLEKGERGKSATAGLPGVACREEPNVHCCFLDNLDAIPRMAWELMPPSSYRTPQGLLTPAQPYAPVCFSRGCPNQCRFCAGGIANGLDVRYRSPEKIVHELLFLRDQYGIRSYGVEDPNFTCDLPKAKAILSTIVSANVGLPWNTPSGIRADKLDQEMVDLMKASGCTAVSFGIECGDQAMLDRLGKNLRLSAVEKAIEMSRNAGLFVTGFFILGFPGETVESLRATVRYTCRLDLDIAIFSRLLPVVGSAFFDTVPEMKGLDSPVYYHQHTYLNNCYRPTAISEQKMRTELRRAHLRFYLRPKTICRLVRHLRIQGLLSYMAWSFRYMKRILLRQADDRRFLMEEAFG